MLAASQGSLKNIVNHGSSQNLMKGMGAASGTKPKPMINNNSATNMLTDVSKAAAGGPMSATNAGGYASQQK